MLESATRRRGRAARPARAGREEKNERRERERRDVSPAAFGRAEKKRVRRRKDDVDEVRRPDRTRERLAFRHALKPAGGHDVFEERNRGRRREGQAENEPSQEARSALNSGRGGAGFVASRCEGDESGADAADGRQGRLTAQKRKCEGDGKPSWRAASHRMPCRQEQPRQVRRRLEVVVHEREREKTAASREHARGQEGAGTRRAEAG